MFFACNGIIIAKRTTNKKRGARVSELRAGFITLLDLFLPRRLKHKLCVGMSVSLMFLRGAAYYGYACAFRAFGEVERGADLGFFGGAAVDAVPERAEAEGGRGD